MTAKLVTEPAARYWQLRTRRLQFAAVPALMGILNVTPDSFSDGGRFQAVREAIVHAQQMWQAGAALIDVGGESTRPYSEPVAAEEEWRRVAPVLQELQRLAIPVSLDTSKADVADRGMEYGVEVINDVTGLEGDPQMPEVARQSGAGICAMHMQGTPQTMQDAPQYDDVVGEIHHYLAARREALLAAGIAEDRICLDPGIGFGKTHAHNLALLAAADRFHDLGCPLLVGHSRKGFIAHVMDDREAERTSGTIGAALALARRRIQVLRVHDVAQVARALKLFEAAGGLE